MKLLRLLGGKPKDKRSGRIVAAINCILNQNARDYGAAKYQGMNSEIIDILKKHGVGVLQMPCPEMSCLGLPRSRPKGLSISDILGTPEGRKCCRLLSISVVDQIYEYVKHNFKVLAILGGDVGSPGCAVHISSGDTANQTLADKSGVFMKELEAELRERNIKVPFRGIRDSNREMLKQDVAWLDNLLTKR